MAHIFQVWVFVGFVVVVVVPPIEEGLQIWQKYQENKSMSDKQNLVTEDSFISEGHQGLSKREKLVLKISLKRSKINI